MFDDKMICADTLRPIGGAAGVEGFSIDVRLPYYRGLGLSMIEEIALVVDGVPIPPERITLSLHGRSYRLDALETTYDDRWDFGEVATLLVRQPGGLAPGRHLVELAERLRISYLPMVPTTRFTREMTLQAPQ